MSTIPMESCVEDGISEFPQFRQMSYGGGAEEGCVVQVASQEINCNGNSTPRNDSKQTPVTPRNESKQTSVDEEDIKEIEEVDCHDDISDSLKELLPKLEVYLNEGVLEETVKRFVEAAFPMLQHLLEAVREAAKAAEAARIAAAEADHAQADNTEDEFWSSQRSKEQKTSKERKPAKKMISDGAFIYDSLQSYPSEDNEDRGSRWVDVNDESIGVRRLSLCALPRAQAQADLETRSIRTSVTSSGSIASSANQCFIHPEKPFRLCWDATALFLILIVSITVPLELSFYFESDPPVGVQVLSYVVDLYFGVDIVLNFFTAYHAGIVVGGQLVTDCRGMARHYLRGWFALDLMATFPYFDVMSAMNGGGGSQGASATAMLKMLKYAKIARVMKVLRVLKLGGLMQVVEEKMVAAHSMTVMFQLSKMTTVMFILSHNVACVWYGFAAQTSASKSWLTDMDLVDATMGTQYVAAFYFAITTGTTVGYGDIHPINTGERALTAVLLVASVGYIGQFLAACSHMVQSLRATSNMVAQSKREALLYMTRREVPKNLQYKVLRYIEHTFDTFAITSLDENVMSHLSDSLQAELALNVAGRIYRQFPFFGHADNAFLTSICEVGSTKRAGIGDTVVAEEQAAHEMYFLVSGEAHMTRRNVLLNILRDSDWFGELALFFPGAVRSSTVKCESNCEFLVLHHDDFHRQLMKFPQVAKKFNKLLKELNQGDPSGLKLQCAVCGQTDHLRQDCPEADVRLRTVKF